MRMGRRGAAYVAALRLTSDEGREMQITLNFWWPQAIVTGIYAWNVIYAVLHNGEPKDGEISAWATVASAALLVLLLWWGGFYG